MKMICPKCHREGDWNFCPDCGAEMEPLEEKSPAGVDVGNHANIMGGIHSSTSDSHNVHNESNVTNYVTQVSSQKSEMEILQEKKNIYLAECKRAYEDNVLDSVEEAALEECRLRLDLDQVTAKTILESVRLFAEQNARKTSLNPIAKTKLKILSSNLQSNNVSALKEQIDNLEAIVNKYEHEELSRKYFLVLAALEPKKCIKFKEDSQVDSYWKSYWCYLAYIKSGDFGKAENLLVGLDRFKDYPEDNMTILATAGSIMNGKDAEAKEYLDAVTGEYTAELQRFVDSIYIILDPTSAQTMGAQEDACAFYLENLFGQKYQEIKDKRAKAEAKRKAREEAERKAREEAERKAKEEAERRAREEAERKAREEAERKAKEEAERKAREEAERKAREEAERKAKEEAERKAREEAERKAREEAERKAKLKAERKAKEEYEKTQAPYAVYIDKVVDEYKATYVSRKLFGWRTAEFRNHTSSLPAVASKVNGRLTAEEMMSQLNNGGFSCHIEALEPAEPVSETRLEEDALSCPEGGIELDASPDRNALTDGKNLPANSGNEQAETAPKKVVTKDNGHEYVDLGLPSGRLWASCNIGASAPEKTGDYFAWGEIETKDNYSKKNYNYSHKADVAKSLWGGHWETPTRKDFLELKQNCNLRWCKKNNVLGKKFTSKINGASIFLPAAGYRSSRSLKEASKQGYYWSSTIMTSASTTSWMFLINADTARTDAHIRELGYTIRPVTQLK